MEATVPNQTRPQSRKLAPRTSKLGLTRLVAKPSNAALVSDVESKVSNGRESAKENPRPSHPPPSAFNRDKAQTNVPAPELKRKGSSRLQLKGSASRLGGLSNLVRRASRNLRDVTNMGVVAGGATSPSDATQFVDVGVNDVQTQNGEMSVEVYAQDTLHAHLKPKTELERVALEGNDPDIGEVMVVTRHKTRAELDPEWAQSQQEEVTTTDAEGRIGKSKSGWWSNKGKKVDGSQRRSGSLSRNSTLQHAPVSSGKEEDGGVSDQGQQPRASQENRGSLVIRAMRSVRSIARISESLQQQPNAGSESGANKSETNILPQQLKGSKNKNKRPSVLTRRPGESTSSWEVGALSSPERESRQSVLVPSANRRRLVVKRASSDKGTKAASSVEEKATPPPPPTRRESLSNSQGSQEGSDGEPVTLIVRPVVNKRYSILSVNDDASGVESATSIEKQNRRSSTGSNIRWDADAMSQMAQKVREERKQLRAQRERERAQTGQAPSPREAQREAKTLARRRTPLSEVFDLSSQAEDNVANVDPIMAATQALIEATPSKQVDAVPQARPRNRPTSSQPRPVGIIALDSDKNDATICVLNGANAELQDLIGTMDLSTTPNVTPVIEATTPEPNEYRSRPASEYLAPAPNVRRASYPEQDQSLVSEKSIEGPSSTLAQPLRRASGSAITQQVAAWPPVATAHSPTSPSQNDPILAALAPVRQRKRTSSSTSSNPPSAFNRLPSNASANEVIPSLTLKTLRATHGNVKQKAKYYGDLDREAKNAEIALRSRKTSYDDGNTTRLVPSVRVRPVSFSGIDASKERDEAMASVDVVTDIPEELSNILAQQTSIASPKSTAAQNEDDTITLPADIPTTTTSNITGVTQESTPFVYTGVDASTQVIKQHTKAVPSLAHSSDYSFCREFSSYDEVNKAEVEPPTQPKTAALSAPSTNVFLQSPPAQPRLTHKSETSVASVESVGSYCVVTQRPTLPPIPPLVLHGRQSSVESTGLSMDDTFAFASKPSLEPSHSLTGAIRPGHRRTRSVISVNTGASRRHGNRGSTGSQESKISFSPFPRPEMSDRSFSPGLPSIMASPISHRSFDLTASEPTSPVSPNTGFTSSDSLFDSPHNRLSSSTTVGSLFGVDAGQKGSKGNLFGPQKPASLISDQTDTSIVSDNGSRPTLECFDGERISSKVLDQLSPCDPSKRKRLVARRNGIPSFEPPTKEETSSKAAIDLDVVDKMLAAEIATASTNLPKSRSLGHRRARTVLSRPLTINVDPIHEGQEDLPGLSHSPSRSRGSSSTSAAISSQNDSSDSAVAIAEPQPETGMVLRRYYTFQREVQQELDHSRQLWEDTAFSADELSAFEPPKHVQEMKSFLDESRKYYVELPSELRARRRARAAPYCVPSAPSSPTQQDTPGSPMDDVFKDLSTWDHRRGRKTSETKIRTRKVSEEKVRSRKTSEEKVRARKVSEKRSKKSAPPPVPSLSSRTFSPFVDSANAPSTQSTEDGLKAEPASLNSTVNTLRRTKPSVKLAIKPQESSQNTASKENVLRSKHSVEGMLESPTGSLRISRPRPKRRGTLTTSPPSTIRL